MVDHNIAFHVFFPKQWRVLLIECSNTALARRCSKRRLDIVVPCSVDRAVPLPPHSYWKNAWISTPSWMLSVYLASCFQHVSNTPWCTGPGLHGGQTMPPGLSWRIPSLARSISFLIQMLSRSRYDELVVSCCHVHLCSKELRRWIQSNREGHVYHLQQHFSYQPFHLPRAWLHTICRNLQPGKIFLFQMHEGVGMSCVSRMLQVSPICWSSKGKPFKYLLISAFPKPQPCTPWPRSLPCFKAFPIGSCQETPQEKRTREESDVCDSAGSEDSAEQKQFTWNLQLITCLSHNPFWKDSNKMPEFKMAKQHLGLILEALVLGHSNPWARSDLSFAPPNGIHEMPDFDLLNTANKHFKHFKHKQEWLRRFHMTSQQLAKNQR